MKIYAASLFLFASAVSASGGLSLDSVEKHGVTPLIDGTAEVSIDSARLAHGPIDKFQVGDNKQEVVNKNEYPDRLESSI